MLGFKPEESMVIVPVHSSLPHVRADLPTTPAEREQAWASIGPALSRTPIPVPAWRSSV
ncbi:hypothetical protein [Yimella lutea]|uniref:hypothetical protein n=1 Tax=Yimella lutea TaxID=587872 RepID=UPI003CCC7488